MSNPPTLVLIPGAWHRPTCYGKIMKLLQEEHDLKCVGVSLPTNGDNPAATFKDDYDAAREAIFSETSQGRNVVVVAHSYGGLVGNSAVKGFARPKDTTSTTTPVSANIDTKSSTQQSSSPAAPGYVIGIILIASGCSLTGLTFMDPFFGHPPPAWKVNNETGFSEFVIPRREFFYHDLPVEEGEFWVSQLTNQSLRALYEGGEYTYAGWLDVPVWYIGTVEDQGLPVVAQRMQTGMARAMGASVEHRELQTSHSPFLSQPEATVKIMVEAVDAFTGSSSGNDQSTTGGGGGDDKKITVMRPMLGKPSTWFKFGLPLAFGRLIGRGILVFFWGRRLWRTGLW